LFSPFFQNQPSWSCRLSALLQQNGIIDQSYLGFGHDDDEMRIFSLFRYGISWPLPSRLSDNRPRRGDILLSTQNN
jgi:hypothetical protein